MPQGYENTNNQLLHDIAELARSYKLSNNELLTIIAQNGGGGSVVRQPKISHLEPSATIGNVRDKVNQILVALERAGILEN